MKSAVLIILVTVSGILAFAAGRQEASAVCTDMSFDQNRNQCIAAIRGFNYFDQGAIDICKSLSFDAEKLKCVTAIGDKYYDPYEIENCQNQNFDKDKTPCLANSGRPYNPYPGPGPVPPGPGPVCLNKQQMVLALQNIDRYVAQGNNPQARNLIHNLIFNLQNCQ